MQKKYVKYDVIPLQVNQLELGESIEEKMRRVTADNEPIENVAPLLFTERKDGVLAECDIRTDRWEIAQDAMTAVEKSITAKRQAKADTEVKAQEDKQ